ncbi:MAG: amino-acid N-acetyltransferase, partial [Kiritimatiellae bacterium]|nr:amino-acid N-acetyltransferase [Kiritimatiellia bacterium]
MDDFTIRQARLKDAERIYALIHLNSDQLVPRSLGNVVESVDRFVVAEAAGELAGCASYQIHP